MTTSIKAKLKKLDGQMNIDIFFSWTAYIILQNMKSEQNFNLLLHYF